MPHTSLRPNMEFLKLRKGATHWAILRSYRKALLDSWPRARKGQFRRYMWVPLTIGLVRPVHS